MRRFSCLTAGKFLSWKGQAQCQVAYLDADASRASPSSTVVTVDVMNFEYLLRNNL